MKTKKIETTTLISSFSDFHFRNRNENDENEKWIEEWRLAYFNLLSWKNTYDIPFVMDIKSNRNNEAFLKLVVKRENGLRTKRYLESLGYGEIDMYDTIALSVEVEWDEDIDDAVIEWA